MRIDEITKGNEFHLIVTNTFYNFSRIYLKLESEFDLFYQSKNKIALTNLLPNLQQLLSEINSFQKIYNNQLDRSDIELKEYFLKSQSYKKSIITMINKIIGLK
jgi:hypothetical protein